MDQPSQSQISLNWNIDTTVGQALTISTNIIRACTSDNIQPLAIMACEKFGAQLAMCPATRLKMERLGRQHHISHVIKNMKLAIGFVPGDAADHLASSDAGTRFLGLAAALFTTGTNFVAAKTLHVLLDQYSPKNQMLPTITQLKHLFDALEPKLKLSGFAEVLLGWSILVSTPAFGLASTSSLPRSGHPHIVENDPDHSLTWPHHYSPVTASLQTNSGPRELHKFYSTLPGNQCPSGADLGRMLSAMSELERIGRAKYIIFSIPPDFAVWVISLVQWCLGEAPSIKRAATIVVSTEERGWDILFHGQAKVTVQIEEPETNDIHIQVFEGLSSLEVLWQHQSQSAVAGTSPWAGMVSPKRYVELRVMQLERVHGLKHVAQVMLMLASQVTARTSSSMGPSLPDDLLKHTVRSFLSPKETIMLFKRLLPTEDLESPKTFDVDKLLPLWRKKSRHVIEEAGFLFHDLLALSLIDNVRNDDPGFCVSISHSRYRGGPGGVPEAVIDFVRGEEPDFAWHFNRATPRETLELIGTITGTAQDTEGRVPLASSKNGQVVYHTVLEDMTLYREGAIRFRSYPGQLILDGERYAFAASQVMNRLDALLDTKGVQPANLTDKPVSIDRGVSGRKPKSRWLCSKDDGFLQLFYMPNVDKDYAIEPNLFLEAIHFLIVCDPCPDNCETSASEVETKVVYCSSLAAAISDIDPRPIRVLQNAHNRDKSTTMFHVGVFSYAFLEAYPKGFRRLYENTIVIVQSEACLVHACQKADAVLQAVYKSDLHGRKAIIVQ